MIIKSKIVFILGLLLLSAESIARTSQQASKHVISANKSVTQILDIEDQEDFELANKGFLASDTEAQVTAESGAVVYDLGAYSFIEGAAPATANPSLWRQSQLNAKHGLYEVVEGIYQVRGFDLANITFIQGESGWIVVDPLTTIETAAKAKRLIDRELGEQKISAVVLTHSHIDHFGGVRGLISEEDLENGVAVIAPKDFVLESVSENILAGNAMSRRASYMFGTLLPKSATGDIGVGLGQGVSNGTFSLMSPSHEIEKTGETLNIDGVIFEFILAIGAEAPSEFMFYLPKYRAFCQAEIINRNLHNMLTPRGAKVRDGRIWSKYIDEAIMLYGENTDVSFGSHHWPTWGSENVVEFWSSQRDLYRYIHDQTLRLANLGVTLSEIPSQLQLPDALAKNFANRSYYGELGFNARSQYQLYYGFFDGNPANLNPLPPVEEAKKYIEYMGGVDAVLTKAQFDFEKGEFTFVVTALNHAVFAEPENKKAKALLADAYTQLAYMAESGVHRNFYLTAAQELKNGVIKDARSSSTSVDLVKSIPLDLYFDLLAVRLNGPKAEDKNWMINFEITDTKEKALLFMSNGALHHRLGSSSDEADVSLSLSRTALDKLNLKQSTLRELITDGEAEVAGNPLVLAGFFALIEEPPFWFNIVTP